jgi:hypothetical protein
MGGLATDLLAFSAGDALGRGKGLSRPVQSCGGARLRYSPLSPPPEYGVVESLCGGAAGEEAHRGISLVPE